MSALTADVRAVVREALTLHRAEPWDALPKLLVVCREGLVGDAYAIAARILPVPEEVWHARSDPIDVLEVIAEVWQEYPPLPGFDIVAVALTFESWNLEAHTPEDAAWMRTHRIADHPRGREGKQVIAVDVDARTYIASYLRGDEEPTYFDTGPAGSAFGVASARGQLAALNRRVPQVLARILDRTRAAA